MTERVKRFLVFGYDDYYPDGGWEDLLSAHDSLDEAIAAAVHVPRSDFGHDEPDDERQLVDLETLAEIKRWRAEWEWVDDPVRRCHDGEPVKLRRSRYTEAEVADVD